MTEIVVIWDFLCNFEVGLVFLAITTLTKYIK